MAGRPPSPQAGKASFGFWCPCHCLLDLFTAEGVGRLCLGASGRGGEPGPGERRRHHWAGGHVWWLPRAQSGQEEEGPCSAERGCTGESCAAHRWARPSRVRRSLPGGGAKGHSGCRGRVGAGGPGLGRSRARCGGWGQVAAGQASWGQSGHVLPPQGVPVLGLRGSHLGPAGPRHVAQSPQRPSPCVLWPRCPATWSLCRAGRPFLPHVPATGPLGMKNWAAARPEATGKRPGRKWQRTEPAAVKWAGRRPGGGLPALEGVGVQAGRGRLAHPS